MVPTAPFSCGQKAKTDESLFSKIAGYAWTDTFYKQNKVSREVALPKRFISDKKNSE